jgi:Icc protein
MKPQKVILSQQHTNYINVVQISDSHILPDSNDVLHGVNTSETLKNVIEVINRDEKPDVVLHTGDLAEKPDVDAYKNIVHIMSDLVSDVYCIPGNHDSPGFVNQLLNVNNIKTCNLLDFNNWRIIMLDSVVPDEAHGQLSQGQLRFLDESLVDADGKFVMIAMHHHPVPVNSPWMDTMKLENPNEFFEIVDQYTNIKAIIWGHIHNDFEAKRNGVELMGTPSTCQQLVLHTDKPEPDLKPLAYRELKLFADGRIENKLNWVSEGNRH